MRFVAVLSVAALATFALSACSGAGNAAPFIAAPGALPFQLAPSSIDLTPDAPSDTFDGQGDIAGVSYTPLASSACAGSNGAIVVAGSGVAQLDVAGAPLIFNVFAFGSAPPAQCTVTVTGSDGSSAVATVNYSAPQVTDVPSARRIVDVTPIATPSAIAFTSLATVAQVSVSGFTGTTSARSSCTSAGSGVQISPQQLSGSGTLYVLPYGQGQIANACTITIADQQGHTSTVHATLAIGSLAKLTAAPSTAQFACAGSTAPFTCQTLASVQISEAGQHVYKIVTRATLKGSCANAFYGPLAMTTDGASYSQSISGSSVPITFSGLLATKAVSCSQIVLTDGETPAQRVRIAVDPTLGTAPATFAAATPPPCTGTDERVADPSAPHGMYVWNPYKVKGGIYESYLESDVIGKDANGNPKDPNICGASLVISWSEIEKTKGNFNWGIIATQAQPYVNAGLTVNLLFADAAEVGTTDTATPQWVTDPVSQGGDGVATVQCTGQPPYPNFIDPTYEADWEDFISHAVSQFSSDPSIGYMRFGIGAGVEAYPGHISGYPSDQCSQAWRALGFTFDAWVAHTRHIINAMGALQTNKQLLIALNYIPGWTNTLYDYPNDAAEDAASHDIGFGTENLGIGHVADPGTTPATCNPQGKNASIYWCQAFTRHAGAVPFEFQPIEAVADPLSQYTIDFGNLLQYALVNNTQLFELYPQDWLEADSPSSPIFNAANQAKWKAAFASTALIVGAQH